MEKPNYLYRGICISAEEFEQLKIHDDIVPLYAPQKNEEGKDIVLDGNEYGIYMTTSHIMAQKAYGCPHTSGSLYNKECLFVDNFNNRQFIHYPKIGIVYEIDTNNLAIKKPWIKSQLGGVYNNGYEGEEWITTTTDTIPNHIIPKENYIIADIVIGSDILNDQITLDISKLTDEQIKSLVVDIIKRRKVGYELFLDQVHAYPPEQRRKINSRLPVYKKLFNAQDGVALYDYSECDSSNAHDLASHLIQQVYNKNKQNIDIDTIDALIKISKQSETTEQLQTNLQLFIDGLTEKINNPNVHERVKEASKEMIKKLKLSTDDLNKKLDEGQPASE